MRLLLLALFLAIVPAFAAAQEQPPEATPTADAGAGAGAGDANATDNGTAAPAGPAPVEIVLEGTDKGGFAFYIPGNPQKNPTITVEPGAQVTIRLKSTGGFHNIHVDGQKASAYVDTGDETVYTFTAPTTPGRLQYWCDPHKSSGMVGALVVGTADAPAGGGNPTDVAGEISGETVDIPGCPGVKAPASVAQGVAGAPTMEDYRTKCAGGATQEETAKEAGKGADLVLPISFGLIALGVVGVAWVHKSYKP